MIKLGVAEDGASLDLFDLVVGQGSIAAPKHTIRHQEAFGHYYDVRPMPASMEQCTARRGKRVAAVQVRRQEALWQDEP